MTASNLNVQQLYISVLRTHGTVKIQLQTIRELYTHTPPPPWGQPQKDKKERKKKKSQQKVSTLPGADVLSQS